MVILMQLIHKPIGPKVNKGELTTFYFALLIALFSILVEYTFPFGQQDFIDQQKLCASRIDPDFRMFWDIAMKIIVMPTPLH